eukprot:m.245788 g.245788  ORF g.245788 m.245788 type:complete len:76 (+) comp15368_c0_seq2:1564-1791(+)
MHRLCWLLVELCVLCGVAQSNNEARRTIKAGGIYLNGKRVEEPFAAITELDVIDGKYSLMQRGQKKRVVVEWVTD